MAKSFDPEAPGHDDTPDGEAARGSGVGIIGTGEPVRPGSNGSPEDLQDDLGEDPTLIDEDSGD